MLKRILLVPAVVFYFGVMGQTTHTVVKGDTAYGIARKYGISLKVLEKLNPSIQNGIVKIGEILVVSETINKETIANDSSLRLGKIIIQPKQTIYGITKKYHISETELRKLNPNLEAKMKIGSEVILPFDRIEKYGEQPAQVEMIDEGIKLPKDINPKDNDDYITHKVREGETVFGIINHYGITIDDLLALNPQISEGLKAGAILRIKKIDKTFVTKKPNELGVVLMLPFDYEGNSPKMRAMALDFLTGAKLAIERNAANGLKMNVKVIDAGSEDGFKNTLVQINPENTDIIIGPFFKSNVVELLNYIDSKKIPIVLPFANSEELYGYGNLIIATPNDEVYTERIAKEVAQVYSNQKIYIVAGKDKETASLLKKRIEKTVKNPNIVLTDSAEKIQLDKNLMTGQNVPVIAILASEEGDDAKDFTNKIIALSKEVKGMRAFSTAYHSSFEKREDELSQANLVYLMDRKINSEGSFEKEILADYENKYCKTPSKYAVIGFDVVNDILSRDNGKGDVFKQMEKIQTQLATKFQYIRAKGTGAYINNGYRVVRLVP